VPDDLRAAIRRHFLRMVLLIVAIAAVALVARRALGIEGRSLRAQTAFTAAWMLANVAVVASGLARIRAARMAARRR
jgi:hypothetical protein